MNPAVKLTSPVLCIGGSDPSGCAGIQADITTLQSINVAHASVITAITAQNKHELYDIYYLSRKEISSQLNSFFHRLNNHKYIIKLGMLGTIKTIEVVARFLSSCQCQVILDPILISTSGKKLFEPSIEEYLMALRKLYHFVTVLTPNLLEATQISGIKINSYADMQLAAKKILTYGVTSVLIKGGHYSSSIKNPSSAQHYCMDYWTDGSKSFWLAHARQETLKVRGTGCTLASSLAGFLCQKNSLQEALVLASMVSHRKIRHGKNNLINNKPNEAIDLPYLSHESHFLPIIAFPRAEKIGFYPIVDDVHWIKKLIPFGIKTIQLRIKNLQGCQLESAIQSAVNIAREHDLHLYINDYWELAIRYGAYGVHLGQEDLHSAAISEIQQAKLYLGISTHCYVELARAHAIAPSYIAFGPIFATQSKLMMFEPQGIAKLKQWRKLVTIPLVAIGGINLNNIDQVVATEVDGIAVISAITRANDLSTTTQQFLNKVQYVSYSNRNKSLCATN